MPLALPVVWSDDHRRHVPDGEVWVGVRIPGTELPERAERIRAALEAAGAPVVAAVPQPDAALHAVHDPALTAYLSGAWAAWSASGFPQEPGQDRVVPYVFPHGSVPSRPPAAVHARAGFFAYDTMTLIGPGTWEAARAAVDVAVTAAGLAADDGGLAYALCRPPGHHATRTTFGGSCYLNNSAAAAAALREQLGGPVAILDIDAHHGNGTQAIFYDDPEVLDRLRPRQPGRGLVPPLHGLRGRDGRRRRGEPQRLPAARDGRRRVAGRSARAGRAGRAARGRWWWRSGSTPRPGTPRRRCG